MYNCVLYRVRIRELEKLVETKTDLINQQNMTLNLMREMTPASNDKLFVKHRWQETNDDY